MTQPQPADEWDFLPTDDEPEVAEPRAAELGALHVRSVAPTTPARDPGRADVARGDDTRTLQRFFDDEQTETTTGSRRPDDDEPDLEDLLESQHYAFAPEPG